MNSSNGDIDDFEQGAHIDVEDSRERSTQPSQIQISVEEITAAENDGTNADALSREISSRHDEIIPVDEENITQLASLHMHKSPTIKPQNPPMSPKSLSSKLMSPAHKQLHHSDSLEKMGRLRLDDDGESTHASSEEDEADTGHAVAGTATLEEHMLIRALEKDFAPLLILQLTATKQSFMRTDMNRFDLLAECRKAVPQIPSKAGGGMMGDGEGDYLGAPVQLRDIRCLQGVSEPAFLIRRGAIIVSIDPINAIITHSNAYMVLPEGADELLSPLLRRLKEAQAQEGDGMAFEFIALEALLITLVNSLVQDVQGCQRLKTKLLSQIKRRMSSRLLTRILRLKKRIDEVLGAVSAAESALEEVQHDDDLMALMYLSAVHADPAGYSAAVVRRECSVMQAEVLLDAYALEFGSLARALAAALREIDDTEDLLRFKLDKARNQLIKLDVLFGVASMFLTVLTAVGGYFGMNLPFGAYTDGSVPPGGNFTPPTGGTAYDPAWPGGPSRSFLAVSAGSSAGAAVLMLATLLLLRRAGALRS